jgi:hypothetical protein
VTSFLHRDDTEPFSFAYCALNDRAASACHRRDVVDAEIADARLIDFLRDNAKHGKFGCRKF